MSTESVSGEYYVVADKKSSFYGLPYRQVVVGDKVFRAFDAELVLRRVGEQEREEEGLMTQRRKQDNIRDLMYPIGYSPRLSNGKLG